MTLMTRVRTSQSFNTAHLNVLARRSQLLMTIYNSLVRSLPVCGNGELLESENYRENHKLCTYRPTSSNPNHCGISVMVLKMRKQKNKKIMLFAEQWKWQCKTLQECDLSGLMLRAWTFRHRAAYKYSYYTALLFFSVCRDEQCNEVSLWDDFPVHIS